MVNKHSMPWKVADPDLVPRLFLACLPWSSISRPSVSRYGVIYTTTGSYFYMLTPPILYAKALDSDQPRTLPTEFCCAPAFARHRMVAPPDVRHNAFWTSKPQSLDRGRMARKTVGGSIPAVFLEMGSMTLQNFHGQDNLLEWCANLVLELDSSWRMGRTFTTVSRIIVWESLSL